jgi:HrpA-like RNA helicase
MNNNIGIFDPEGSNLNPLNNKPYSDQYKALASVWKNYPAYSKRNEILESITKNQLTLIISATGSGKSVIVPKIALHYTNYKGKVVMTLPKRVITLSAATFAAKTLDVELGNEIGYQYKGSPSNMSNQTNKIIYMTDGLLITMLLFLMKFMKEIYESICYYFF